MKIYYNFVRHVFGMNPTGPCMSAETGEEFNPKEDLEEFRYYKDCECVEMFGDKFTLYIIHYEDGDGERDFFGHKSKEDFEYFDKQLQPYLIDNPTIVKKIYEKFGYEISQKKYVSANGSYFMICTWSKL